MIFLKTKKKDILTVESGVAQRKRAGLITQRSVDRNHSPLYFFYYYKQKLY